MAKFKNDKGLTLIELLITIAVLAVVSAIALPVINNVVSSSNSNAAAQTQSDVTDFITKYNAAGEVLVSLDGRTLQGYVDTDGDNVIDSNELIDTLTIDAKFSFSAAGTSDNVGGSYAARGITGATVGLASTGGTTTPPSAPAPLTLNAAHFGVGSSHYFSNGSLRMMGDSSNTSLPSSSYDGTAEAYAAVSNLKVGDTLTYTGTHSGPVVLTVSAIELSWSSGSGTTKMWTISYTGSTEQWWGMGMGSNTADSSVTVTFTYN
jgi:prepilin-type N-terminal cleavage/methylation domain-containing protein